MSIMGIIDIGSKALAAQKTALDVTGQNISNANTAGYSRQTVVLESAPGSVSPQFNMGNGVRVAAVQRAHDVFLQTQIQGETSNNGKQTVLQDAMAKVEPLFNEAAASGLGTSLEAFFTAWQDLSVNPQGSAERQAVLGRAQTVVDDFHRVSLSLNDQLQQAGQSVTGLTADINTRLKQLADYNAQIKVLAAGGDSANPLRDSRDQLLQELSRKVGITSQEQADGTVKIMLGSSSSTYTLLDGTTSSVFAVDATTTAIIAADSRSGELGGTLQVRDTVLPGFIASLDSLASSLATEVNGVHTGGYGLDGTTTGENFFTVATSGASSGISINTALLADSNKIAAAGAPFGGTGDNRNALKMAALKTALLAGTQTTLSGLYSSLVGDVGVAAQNSQQGATQSTAMLKQLDNLRESVVGVALDEELTKLIAFQKAYEGAAKLITTGQEMIDTVLNMVR